MRGGTDPFLSSLSSLVEALARAVERDESLREALRDLGRRLLELAEATGPEEAGTGPAPSTPTDGAAVEPAELVERTLRVGGSVTVVRVPGDGPEPERPPVLEPAPPRRPVPALGRLSPSSGPSALRDVVQRCRLKARACRWAMERRRRLQENADFARAIDPTDKELAQEARELPGCHLWMLDPYLSQPDADLEVAAECYENLVLAVEAALEHVESAEGEPDADLLQMIATIQSALRAAVHASTGREDRDQRDVFEWLRQITFRTRIFSARNMRGDDPADPRQWNAQREALTAWLGEHERRRGLERQRGHLLARVRYHAARLVQRDRPAKPHDQQALDRQAHDWQRILEAAADWVRGGFPPTDRELCAELARLEDIEVPDDATVSADAQRVLDAVDEYVSLRQQSAPAAEVRPREPSEEVRRASALLRGRVAVLIGGKVRPYARAALERDLELAELRWVETRSGLPLERVGSEIVRPEVAVVILAIRWSSHVYKSFAEVCDRAGVPFVRLRAGYNPRQVARQVLEQAGRMLGEAQGTLGATGQLR